MARSRNRDGNVREKSRPSSSPFRTPLPQNNNDVIIDGNESGGAGQQPRTPGLVRVKSAGESGRRGIHPLHFFKIIWTSSSAISRAVNVLWPFVPAALAVHYTKTGSASLRFALAYVAMVPCANLIGFAGGELARKLPHIFGILLETTIGSVVEIILFLVLLLGTEDNNRFYIIRAAILGSILATMLLCLGLCFFAAGLRRSSATFDSAISEVGTGLLLMAGLGLAIPTIFQRSITPSDFGIEKDDVDHRTLELSRAVSILLLIAYVVYVWFQTHTHHGIYDAIYEHDEHRDADGHIQRLKPKLTLTECIVSLSIAVALVTLIAIVLVQQIEPVVAESGLSDPFMGLILVPLVEKAAEHLTALDEAWDNQINFALSHCIGATIQTAMLNAPLIVIVAWGRHLPLDLSFEIFEIAVLILAIITVGNYLRDQKSDYLEGFLCIITYIAIAAAAFYFPNSPEAHSSLGGHGEAGASGEVSGGHGDMGAAGEHARFMMW